MCAFAGNSILCRAAFTISDTDASSFTFIRLIAGALTLWLLVCFKNGPHQKGGNWISAFALFVYAAAFSFAYLKLPAATGALLLFGAVQATMIGYGIWRGERLNSLQFAGFLLAFGGLVGLLLPGLLSPSLSGSFLMLIAGVAWGVYSLRGKEMGNSIRVTAGNFSRAVLFAAILCALSLDSVTLDCIGFWYAVSSGALTSGIGYVVWYMVLPAIKATTAATVQLSVPVIAAMGGVVLLGEPITLRLAIASVAVLGGIALIVVDRNRLKWILTR